MSGPPARTGSSSMAASDAVLIASSSPAAPPPLSFSIGSPPFHSTVTTTSLSPPRPALVHSPSSAPSFATRASVDAAGNARAPPPPPGSTLPRKLGKILHLSSSSSSGTTTKSSLFPPRSADLASGFPRSSSTTLNAVGAGSVRVSEDGDGPWRISVAAEGRVSAKIVVYASTATHNYTFLRATHEIQDLHDKLTATLPPSILPVLPRIAADESTIKAPAPSRRRSFLNAFAKFSADGRGVSSTAQSTKNGLISPPQSPMLAGTPYKELGDPFNTTLSSTTSAPPSSFKHVGNPDASVSASTSVSSMSSFSGSALDIDEASSNVGSGVGPHSPMAALAEYLTVISNMPAVRKTRGWKRFTRVRGDDLISVRVERKIQRTRSAQGLNTLASSSSSGSRTGKSNSILQSTSDSCVSDDDAILIETDEEGGVADVTGTIPVASGSRAASASPQEQDMEILASVPPSPSSLGGAELPTPAPSPSAAKTLPPTPSSGSGPHTPSKTIFGAAGAADFKGSASDSQSSSHSDQISPAQTRPPPRPASADPDKSSSKVAQWAEEGAKRKLAVAATRRKPKVTIEDFELIRVLGRGCAGKVLLVRQKNGENRGLLAMKSIVKRHVLAHQELQHTLTEQAVLKRMSRDLSHPFIVHLHHSFHDKENLFLVMDFHPGGDLATQLARWGRFGRDRARFYAAEIVEGVQGLHAAGVIYRDLKPENILLDQAGHLVLTDFGLSKEFPRKALSSPLVTLSDGSVAHFDLDPLPIEPGSSMTDQARRDWSPLGSRTTDTTSTFCGTAEYLAPEVIQGLPYSYEVDWWSLGTMLYEMLIGVTPFWASNHTDMYTRVLHDDLVFPTDRPVDQDTKSLIRGLLQRNPALRLGEPRLKKHPYFSMIDWDHVYHKRYIPPYTPPTDPNNEMDTQNFDEAFLGMEPTVGADPEGHGDGLGLAAATSLGVVPTPTAERMEDGRCVSLFDGYSYRENDTLSIMEEDDDELVPGSPRRQHQHRQEKSDGTMAEGSTEVEDARLAELIASEAELVTVLAGGNYPEVLDTAVGEQREREEEEASSASSTTTAEDTSSSDALSSPVLARQPPLGHRSGIPALDKGLPSDLDTEDDDEDDEDEDWDLVEAPVHKGHIALNGGSRTLFARGVVDRYKQVVLLGVLKRKESRAIITPSTHQPSSQPGSSLGTPSKGDVSHTLASSTTTTRRGLPFTPSRFRVRPKPIVSALSSSNATTTVVKPPSPSLSSTGERSPTKPSGVPINSGRVPSASSSSSVSAEEDSAGGGFGGMGTARRRDRKKFGGAETFRDLFGRGHSGPGSP